MYNKKVGEMGHNLFMIEFGNTTHFKCDSHVAYQCAKAYTVVVLISDETHWPTTLFLLLFISKMTS